MKDVDAKQVVQNSPQVEHTKIVPLSSGEKPMEIGHFARMSRLDDSLYSKELAPHYMQLATKLASSDLIPKSFRGKPQDLFICWAMGYQVGLTPEQSQQCIAVINGKPAMWGDDMLALCMAHPAFDDIIETPIVKNDSVIGYNCTVKRKGKADKESIFTMDMAKKAGLLAKGGVWNQYPERMLKLRARGFCLRDAFPDALKGIKPREEVEDYIEGEYTVTDYKGSRTELLKKDYLIKTGKVDNENPSNSVEAAQDCHDSEEVESNDGKCEMENSGEKTALLCAQIKRLLDEKCFTEERLTKALEYYETEAIEDMTIDQMEHFINKLSKI